MVSPAGSGGIHGLIHREATHVYVDCGRLLVEAGAQRLSDPLSSWSLNHAVNIIRDYLSGQIVMKSPGNMTWFG